MVGERAVFAEHDEDRHLDFRNALRHVTARGHQVVRDADVVGDLAHFADHPFLHFYRGLGEVEPVSQRLAAPSADAVLFNRRRVVGFTDVISCHYGAGQLEWRVDQHQRMQPLGMRQRRDDAQYAARRFANPVRSLDAQLVHEPQRVAHQLVRVIGLTRHRYRGAAATA